MLRDQGRTPIEKSTLPRLRIASPPRFFWVAAELKSKMADESTPDAIMEGGIEEARKSCAQGQYEAALRTLMKVSSASSSPGLFLAVLI